MLSSPTVSVEDIAIPPVSVRSLVSSCCVHLCFMLGRCGGSCHASRDLVRLADSLDREPLVSLIGPLNDTCLPHHRQGIADCLDRFSDSLADILRAHIDARSSAHRMRNSSSEQDKRDRLFG